MNHGSDSIQSLQSPLPAIYPPGSLESGSHCRLLIQSFQRWMGRPLLEAARVGSAADADLARWLFDAPFVLVSHGLEPDPILNFGNRRALELWEMTWEELTRMPSRLTAEAPDREERARLLDRVTRFGYIDNYSGVRISKAGKRFQIQQAIVWNLLDDTQIYRGQAAVFDQWTELNLKTAVELGEDLQRPG